jgi:hypothetical protein
MTETINTRMEPRLTLDSSSEYCKTAPTIIEMPQIVPITKSTSASPAEKLILMGHD